MTDTEGTSPNTATTSNAPTWPAPVTTFDASTEKGFEVRSQCGRVWFVPHDAVIADYAAYLEQEDKLSKEDALAQARQDEGTAQMWFTQQFNWSDIDRHGRLVREASAEDLERALKFMRTSGQSAPSDDFEEHNMPA